ncbi:MAG: hypothetical protein ACTHZX_01200, partial [Microbacterium sp.]
MSPVGRRRRSRALAVGAALVAIGAGTAGCAPSEPATSVFDRRGADADVVSDEILERLDMPGIDADSTRSLGSVDGADAYAFRRDDGGEEVCLLVVGADAPESLTVGCGPATPVEVSTSGHDVAFADADHLPDGDGWTAADD